MSPSWLPLLQNMANRAMVRSPMALDFETMIDLRLKRPNQGRFVTPPPFPVQ